jgi:tetratricopeptide (TPR) repeat protein
MKKSILGLALVICISSVVWGQDHTIYDEGIAKFKAQDYASVIQLYSGMLANKDRNNRYDEDLYFYRGQSYYFTGESDNALADLDKALELNHYNKATINWFKARCYSKKGNASEAESYYKDAVELSQNNRKLQLKYWPIARSFIRNRVTRLPPVRTLRWQNHWIQMLKRHVKISLIHAQLPIVPLINPIHRLS